MICAHTILCICELKTEIITAYKAEHESINRDSPRVLIRASNALEVKTPSYSGFQKILDNILRQTNKRNKRLRNRRRRADDAFLAAPPALGGLLQPPPDGGHQQGEAERQQQQQQQQQQQPAPECGD